MTKVSTAKGNDTATSVPFPIDAVITWVDGNDPRHMAKRLKYGNDNIFRADDVAGSTRYASVGEILYCIASLNRFAPWLNKIYIVTDEQTPPVAPFIEKHFPDGHIPMEIVDHKSIFRGYEENLPTFNSISIESMTWRIPGLSEHYIEFNDDLILAAPTTPEDFFTSDGKVVCYGKTENILLVRLTRLLKYRANGYKKVTYKETMVNAALHAGQLFSYIKMHHTPKALLKSVYENHFAESPQTLKKNIAYRFRFHKQFNPQELQYLKLQQKGLCSIRKVSSNLLYLQAKRDDGYIREKLKAFSARPDFKFACFNSIDQATDVGQDMIVSWIKERLQLNRDTQTT